MHEATMNRDATFTDLNHALGSLRAELTRLNERLDALESAIGAQPTAPAVPTEATSDHIDEATIIAISAAIAAYLGVKPHIRQIRLLSGATWSQQGRVTIQASHNLPVRHN